MVCTISPTFFRRRRKEGSGYLKTSKARNSLPDLLRFFLIKYLEGICLPFYLSGPTGTLNHLRAYEITGLSIIQSCSLDRLEVEVYLSILEISDLRRSEALDLVLSIYLRLIYLKLPSLVPDASPNPDRARIHPLMIDRSL